jgi:hygromycin-B 4-O-kinase
MDAEQQSSPDVVALSEAAGVGTARVEAFLVDRFGPGISHVVRVGQGEWSAACAFQHDGSDWIARFGAFQEDFVKDRLAGRYGSRDLPIPAVTEIGQAFAGFYAISERAFGEYIDVLDHKRMHAMLPSLFATLDAARDVDLSGSAGYGGWGADGKAPYSSWREALLDVATDRPGDRAHGWRDRLAASSVGSMLFEEACSHLHALIDRCPDVRHLVHGDLLNNNVLVQDGRISAVLDWGCSMYGDFLYDFAWFAFWEPWYPAWGGIDFRDEALRHFEAIGLDVPAFDDRFRCCQLHIGLDGQAYNAFKGRWQNVEQIGKRTLAVGTGSC